MQIDFGALARAQEFYAGKGYSHIEVPWLVSKEISSITAPPDVLRYVVTKGEKVKEFVASGEQGFLYLYTKGYLDLNDLQAYQTTTPCLRNDAFDGTHSKQFMKNELFIPGNDLSVENLGQLLNTALEFFLSEFSEYRNVGINPVGQPDGSTDIEATIDGKNYELGSYGIRRFQEISWVYGTGCAEPRLSTIKRIAKNVLSPR